MTDKRKSDLTDPGYVPTDDEELDILRSVARRVAWEQAMGKRGIKVLALGLTPEQEDAAIETWARENAVLDMAESGAASGH